MLHFLLVKFWAVIREDTHLTGYHCNGAGQSVGESWFCAIMSWQGTEQTRQCHHNNNYTISRRGTKQDLSRRAIHFPGTNTLTHAQRWHVHPGVSASAHGWPHSSALKATFLWSHWASASMACGEAAMQGCTRETMLCPSSAVSGFWRYAFN